MTALLDEIELDSSRCFFAGVDFNTVMTHSGSDINVYFDRQWLEIDGDENGVSVHQPTVIMHMADDPTVKVNDTVTIDSGDYVVRDIQFDRGETGDVILVLSQ